MQLREKLIILVASVIIVGLAFILPLFHQDRIPVNLNLIENEQYAKERFDSDVLDNFFARVLVRSTTYIYADETRIDSIGYTFFGIPFVFYTLDYNINEQGERIDMGSGIRWLLFN